MSHDLPTLRSGPTVWTGSEMIKRTHEWMIYLNQHDIFELEQAIHSFVRSEMRITDIYPENFMLPKFGRRLEEIRDKLIHGIGFSVLRGLPIDRYSEIEMLIIFYGIGSYLGHARSQNAMGHLIGHVCNVGLDSTDPKVRIYQTSERQTFHTDSCDVVGLLCIQPAKEGGMSLLVSAETVYNEMYKRRPDLLKLLMEPIATDRRGEVPDGELPYLLIPVFTEYQGKITPFYQRQYIESAQRFKESPRLTSLHNEALDLFDDLCNDSDLHLTMMLERGDMQFVYNHAMLHDRTSFVDFEAIGERRHLARLWLSVPGDRALDPIFATRFGSVEIGNRGGIIVPGTQLHVPLRQDVMS